MKKVALLIPAHCMPEVLKLTVGSCLETHDGSYEVSLCVALHENYTDYSTRLDEITSMPNVNFVFVKEIDWNAHGLLRYSTMHATSLLKLLDWAVNTDCTHIAVLDHDLVFEKDFVSWALSEHGEADWLCGLFEDVSEPRKAMLSPNECLPEPTECLFAPKPTVWHMVLSRRMLEVLAADKDAVMPEQMGKTIYDTLAKAYEMAPEWDMKVKVIPCADFEPMVRHLWSLSFNFGYFEARLRRGEEHARRHHEAKVKEAIEYYDRRFPSGIDSLLEKLP